MVSLPWISMLGFTTEHWAMLFSKQVGPVGVISYLFMWLSCPTQTKTEILPPGGLFIQYNTTKFYLGSTLGEEHKEPWVTLNWEGDYPNKWQNICPEGPQSTWKVAPCGVLGKEEQSSAQGVTQLHAFSQAGKFHLLDSSAEKDLRVQQTMGWPLTEVYSHHR